ncbi:hypothetical protein B0H19DRAFT_868148, partial [Mycena capillaripes]
LNWSRRRPTNAAQKVPPNWQDLCEKAFLRIAYAIKEHDIPSCLYVNLDQTQIVYAPGTGLTWSERGTKQVSVVGVEEKRAFTLVVIIANDGTLLPFQVIYDGFTPRSLPQKGVRGYAELCAIGTQFMYSGTETYWANQVTMRALMTDIVVPYFQRKKQQLGLPPTQRSVLQFDLWSVHKSQEFRDWLAEKYPWIILDYIPGGVT